MIVSMELTSSTAYSMKLIGNSFIVGMLESLAESMTLAEKTGVGVDTVSN